MMRSTQTQTGNKRRQSLHVRDEDGKKSKPCITKCGALNVCANTRATSKKHRHPSSKMMTTENSRVNATQTQPRLIFEPLNTFLTMLVAKFAPDVCRRSPTFNIPITIADKITKKKSKGVRTLAHTKRGASGKQLNHLVNN